jgi:hypothetical protein
MAIIKIRNKALTLLDTANGKIAGSNLDVSFENITDTGTEGTKVATGTTAQRGSTAGQLRFNSTTGLAEYYTGTTFKSIDSPPSVDSVNISNFESSALPQNVVITGSNFGSGATVIFIGSDATQTSSATVTIDSATQITAEVPNTLTSANEPYSIKVTNVSGLSSTLTDAFNIDASPVFSVASGSLGTLEDTDRSASNLTNITATDDEGDTVTFSITVGSAPTGLTLGSNGVWSGTADGVGSNTTSTFTVTASDGTNTSTRQYSITVNSALVTYDVLDGISYAGTTLAQHNSLNILVDPYDSNSDTGSALNNLGNGVSAPSLVNMNRGGTGSGKYWEFQGSGFSDIFFGSGSGDLTNTSDRKWAYAGWWYATSELDTTNDQLWIINDGDWSPENQVGIRFGQSGNFKIHSGNTTNLANSAVPSRTYTNKWIFVGVWHAISGGLVGCSAFATDTNLTFSYDGGATSSPRSNNTSLALTIGSRNDARSAERTPNGYRMGSQMFWGNNNSSFATDNTTAKNNFEAIFDGTKGRYL